MNKVLELVWSTRSSLILTLLSLSILNPSFILGRGFVVSSANTVGDSVPNFSTLHLTLLLDRFHGNLFTCSRCVPENFVARTRDGFALVLANAAHSLLDSVENVSASADGGLVRVCFAREVSFAGVAERGQKTSGRLDVRITGKLNVRRTVPETLDEQVGRVIR